MTDFADQSQEERYFSPINVRLFTPTTEGPVWLDEAIGIEYRIDDQRSPHFGYRDELFRAVSYGKSVVSGNLYVAFSKPNYLTPAIMKSESPGVEPEYSGKNVTEYMFKDASGIAPADLLSNLAEQASKNLSAYIEGARRFKEEFYGKRKKEISTMRPAEAQSFYYPYYYERKPFSIYIYYGDDPIYDRPLFFRTIHDVILTSESHPISMLDGNGDQMLIEMYSFFARRVTATPMKD